MDHIQFCLQYIVHLFHPVLVLNDVPTKAFDPLTLASSLKIENLYIFFLSLYIEVVPNISKISFTNLGLV